MERKFTDAKKVIKKNGQKLENLEQSNKMLKDENEKLKSDMKLSDSEAITTLKSVSSKMSQTSTSLFSSSLESSTLHFVPGSNLQPAKKQVPQVDFPSFSMARKPFPPITFKPSHPTENMFPGKLFPPFQNFEDGNNNPTVETKKSESFSETQLVDAKYSARDAINKSSF